MEVGTLVATYPCLFAMHLDETGDVHFGITDRCARAGLPYPQSWVQLSSVTKKLSE